MYEKGLGVALDYVEACKWFRLAEAQGDQLAKEARKSLATIMTKHQLIAVEGKIAEWQSQHQRQP
jgi:TPR repeat protein